MRFQASRAGVSEKGADEGDRNWSSGSAGEAPPAPCEVEVEDARADVDEDEAIALEVAVIVRVVW